MSKARGLPLKSGTIFVQAALVGGVGGLLGVAFRKAVVWGRDVFLGPPGSAQHDLDTWICLTVPTIGGVLAGLCLMAARNTRGPFGITDVMELVMTRKGTIRPGRSLIHILSSAFSISSGGSIGREGANSQLGATLAAVLGRAFGSSSRTRTVLLGCGIAAGMASAYKAPIAGALFVMEVVLGNFAMDVLAPIVVASVVATLVTSAFFGDVAIYAHDVTMHEWPLVGAAMFLGAMCGFGGVAFRRTLRLGATLFERIPASYAVRMGLGGLIVGAIGIWWPEVWGNGQRTIEIIADETPVFGIVAVLTVLKVVATAVTTGSGALGGVFTPTLVVGAAFGSAFGGVVELVMPEGFRPVHDSQLAFTLVGMAGMCAATTHAPITAMILIFELTGEYGLILPVMLCCIIGSLTSRFLDHDSIYTARLRARGHEMPTGIEELAMHRNYVRDIMRSDFTHVVHTAPFDEVLDIFARTRNDAIYVTDPDGLLVGHIQIHDVKQFINDGTLGTVVIAADLTRNSPFTYAAESLAAIIERFDDPDLDELPVVRSATEPLLQGRITRRDLVTCLSEEVLGQRTLRAKLRAADSDEPDFVELPANCSVARLRVPDALVDRSIDSLGADETAGLTVMLVIEPDGLGGERRALPAADTVLADGMDVVVVGRNDAIAAFRKQHGLG